MAGNHVFHAAALREWGSQQWRQLPRSLLPGVHVRFELSSVLRSWALLASGLFLVFAVLLLLRASVALLKAPRDLHSPPKGSKARILPHDSLPGLGQYGFYGFHRERW